MSDERLGVIYVEFQLPLSWCHQQWLKSGELTMDGDYMPEPEMQSGYIKLVRYEEMIVSITVDTVEGELGQSITVAEAGRLADRLWEEKKAQFIPRLLDAVEAAGITLNAKADQQHEKAIIGYRLDITGSVAEGPLYFVSGYDFYPIVEGASLPRLTRLLRETVLLAFREEIERQPHQTALIVLLPSGTKFN